MDDPSEQDNPKVQADDNSIAIGGINVGGNVGDIRIGHITGYTPEEVSVLLTQIKSTFQPKPFDGRCPYKGLDAFEEEEADEPTARIGAGQAASGANRLSSAPPT